MKFDEDSSIIKTTNEILREKMLKQINWIPFPIGFENNNEQSKHEHTFKQELSENSTL